MANQKIRIRLKAFEHGVLDQSAQRIVESAKKTGAENFYAGKFYEE